MKKKLVLLLLSCCLAASVSAVAVSAAEGGGIQIGANWTQDEGGVYTVSGIAAGGIGRVSYSGDTWTTVGDDPATAVTTYRAVHVPVEGYVPGATPYLDFKFRNNGAYGLVYLKYDAYTDENLEQHPAGMFYVGQDLFGGAGWSVEVTDYGDYKVSSVQIGSYVPTQVVTEIVLYFEKSPEDNVHESAATGEKSVEFLGMAFHAKGEQPFAPTEPTISAPTASSGIPQGSTVEKQTDGSYRIGYTTTEGSYGRFLINFANFTAEDKCLTFAFTPYAGMKFGLYVKYRGIDADVMLSGHKVYPISEKQVLKFDLSGEAPIEYLKLYVDVTLAIDEMKYFTVDSVTLEKQWPVLFSGLAVDSGSKSVVTTEDNETYRIAPHAAAYHQLTGTVNPAIWQTKPLVKHFKLSFTPAQEMLVGVYANSDALAGKDESGNAVSGHVSYPAGVRQTLVFDLSDEDYPAGPEILRVYLDAGVAADAEKQIVIHEAALYPEPNITDFVGDAIYYVKYDASTRETVVKFSDHGTWYKITAPISDYRSGYDIVAFRVKADRDMYLGLRLTNADSAGGNGNADLKLHELIEADTAYDFVYTGFTVNENTRLEIYCDAPGSNYQPVPDGETVLTIQSVDFLRSEDLTLPRLSVPEQLIEQEYTGTNQIIRPQVDVDSPVAYAYEYLDTNKENAKWSNVAPVNAGTYSVRVVTALTREYMTVTDEGHITLTVLKSQTKQDLPDGAVTVDYRNERVLFGAEYEVNAADTFAQETAYKSGDKLTPGTTLYMRVKESANTVAGNTAVVTLPARTEAIASPGIDYAAITTANAVSADTEYSIDDGENWTAGTGAALPLEPGKTYLFRKRAGSGAFAGETVSLAVPARPAAPAAPSVKESGTDYIELAAAEGCEYSLNGGAWQDAARFEGLAAGTLYTVEVRVKAGNGSFASASVTVECSTKAEEKAPPAPAGCGCGTIAPTTLGGIFGALIPVAVLTAALLFIRRKSLRSKMMREERK